MFMLAMGAHNGHSYIKGFRICTIIENCTKTGGVCTKTCIKAMDWPVAGIVSSYKNYLNKTKYSIHLCIVKQEAKMKEPIITFNNQSCSLFMAITSKSNFFFISTDITKHSFSLVCDNSKTVI